ncbi:DNA-protecting protein DprA [Carnobacteriaceae bacterium zg-ZUI78]|uniref:DNA-processing protein DprA n=1 Tax=Granulicatella sp. zg-84 TaxID=2678503 RepID=UPI0013BF03A8|nr:DNA-processing protein DprA [Granulicatella sp. zg-84]MBS4750819.1 DNA-protecting protein DprA [Carnobacteriaceae bacterium zg-ZUI78]NEW65842.1 hypothetical protein [Granulicatella sp. zg-84]QMI86379.1 DNA-protecting protein DprA [Carnobacteriaceae bacterium zg-84]
MFQDVLLLFIHASYGTWKDGIDLVKCLLHYQHIQTAIYHVLDKQKAQQFLVDLKQIEQIRAMYQQHQIKIITIFDSVYPIDLLRTRRPPLVLFCKGQIDLLKDKKIGVFSSRYFDHYGEQVLSNVLMKSHYDVFVSSLCDKHIGQLYEQTLIAHKKCIAVLATGCDVSYPLKYIFLQRRLQEKGLIITEYPLGTFFNKQVLKRQMELVVSLSDKICGIQTCSHHIAVEFTLEQGKSLFVPPHSLFLKQGDNQLIKEGAIPLLSPTTLNEE